MQKFIDLVPSLFYGSQVVYVSMCLKDEVSCYTCHGYCLQKSPGYLYSELLREVDTNTFHLIEEYETKEAFEADTAMDHIMGFFNEMGVVWGDIEFGTDKAVQMEVHFANTVPVVNTQI